MEQGERMDPTTGNTVVAGTKLGVPQVLALGKEGECVGREGEVGRGPQPRPPNL